MKTHVLFRYNILIKTAVQFLFTIIIRYRTLLVRLITHNRHIYIDYCIQIEFCRIIFQISLYSSHLPGTSS